MPDASDLSQNRPIRRREQRAHSSEMQGWTVVIVDDQIDNLVVAEATLRFCGATVFTAENGVLGMKLIETTPEIRLILLDLSMPEMDGWDVHERLRQNPATAAIPVIALTAHAMEGDYERVMQAGFTGYIPKPFSVATLAATILAILKEEKAP